MSDKIDYSFLSELEGGSVTKGYVPAAGVSKSGVTIGTGFDLGQRNETDLKTLGLSSALIAILKPYLGKQAKDAQAVLDKTPLSITFDQAAGIDKAVKKAHIDLIKQNYNAVSENKKPLLICLRKHKQSLRLCHFNTELSWEPVRPSSGMPRKFRTGKNASKC